MSGLMDKAKEAMGKAAGNKEESEKVDKYANEGTFQSLCAATPTH